MNIVPFLEFTLNSRYITRWLYAGLILYIPILWFFSLGFLSRTSRLVIIGGIGLPTWQEKYETWIEGVKLLFIFILYNAITLFLFSCGFFLISLNIFTAFFGHILKISSYVALIVCTFPVPFAFVTFAEKMDFKEAFEFEKIFKGVKEVFFEYLIGYIVALCGLCLCLLIMRIPYLIGLIGLIPASILSYYILLVSTYYFTELYKRTSLAPVRMDAETENATGNLDAEL